MGRPRKTYADPKKESTEDQRMRDLKEALSSARKPDITHVRGAVKRYIARACEYGSARYERSNFLRQAAPFASPKADFERLRSYLRATVSHLDATLDAMELHQAGDPNLEDTEGMQCAAYAADTDAKPGCPVGASGLPHLAHAAASMMMAIEQATLYGLLPADPGQPWVERVELLNQISASGGPRPLPDLAAEVAEEFDLSDTPRMRHG